MNLSSSEDDQQTIKRCYYNIKKNQLNSKNITSLHLSNPLIKKPLDQLFYQHFINHQDSQNIPQPKQNSVHFLTPSQHQKSLELNNVMVKLEQIKNEKDQNLSQCCTRLFTFMESTQKEKFIDQNKQNQFRQNLLNIQDNFRNSLKPNINDLPLKIHPKKQRSTKFLKKIDHRSKNQQKSPHNHNLIPKDKQKDLLNFIEGSRKKREELLIQLEQLNFDHLENICHENIKYLTPQERLSKKSTPKIKVQSSRNSVQQSKLKKNFFRKHSLTNDKKSPRIVMKENLRLRHFSQNSFKQPKSRTSPKNPPLSCKNVFYHTKRQNTLRKLQQNDSKKHIFTIKVSETNLTKNQSNGRLSERKSGQKLVKKNKKPQISRNSLSRKDFNKKISLKESQEKKNEKTMEQLMKKKKELQKDLINLNDDIILFNKKKKKPLKNAK